MAHHFRSDCVCKILIENKNNILNNFHYSRKRNNLKNIDLKNFKSRQVKILFELCRYDKLVLIIVMSTESGACMHAFM